MVAEDPRVAEFLQLLTRQEMRLRSLSLSLVPHWADAEEVLQQAFLVMWKKFDTFDRNASFFSWSTTIVVLTAKDFRKRQRNSIVQFNDEFYDLVADETDESADELSEREAVLSECFKKLKPRHRELINQRYEQRFSGEQIAALMNTSVDAVYQALARIRKALFDCVTRGMRQRGLT